jgi:hemoglobin
MDSQTPAKGTNMAELTLYERIGGATAIDTMVVEFYNRVLSDGELQPFFEHTEMDKLRAMQREFFSAALDGPITYTGRPLAYVHHGHGIGRKHFAKFVDHLLQTLKARGLPEGEVRDVIARVSTYIGEVVGDSSPTG